MNLVRATYAPSKVDHAQNPPSGMVVSSTSGLFSLPPASEELGCFTSVSEVEDSLTSDIEKKQKVVLVVEEERRWSRLSLSMLDE